MEFPEQEDLFAEQDVFLLGDALLVAPVVKEGATSVEVNFPKKSVWFRVFDDGSVLTSRVTSFSGGKQTVDAPLERGTPVFQKGGSIIPLKLRPRRSSTQMAGDPFTLQVAVDDAGQAAGSVYLDDGHSLKYSQSQETWSYRSLSFASGVLSNKCATGPCLYSDESAVERILIMGLSSAPSKVTFRAPGSEDRVLQHSFSSVFNLLTIRQPGVQMNADWTIQIE
jgi:hypothetical protein